MRRAPREPHVPLDVHIRQSDRVVIDKGAVYPIASSALRVFYQFTLPYHYIILHNFHTGSFLRLLTIG